PVPCPTSTTRRSSCLSRYCSRVCTLRLGSHGFHPAGRARTTPVHTSGSCPVEWTRTTFTTSGIGDHLLHLPAGGVDDGDPAAGDVVDATLTLVAGAAFEDLGHQVQLVEAAQFGGQGREFVDKLREFLGDPALIGVAAGDHQRLQPVAGGAPLVLGDVP